MTSSATSTTTRTATGTTTRPIDFDRGRARHAATTTADTTSPYVAPGPRSVPGNYDEHTTHGALAMRPAGPTPRTGIGTAIRPVTVKLTGFGEARVIGEKFREGKPVILDMTEMDDAGARRLVDFAAGLAFALRGSIDKVTTKVFMLLPPDTDAADIPAYEPAQAGFSGGFGCPVRQAASVRPTPVADRLGPRRATDRRPRRSRIHADRSGPFASCRRFVG